MWTKGKLYEVLNKEVEENKTVVRIKDDAGKKHWIRVGSTFKIVS
jgi:hypothetical protein